MLIINRGRYIMLRINGVICNLGTIYRIVLYRSSPDTRNAANLEPCLEIGTTRPFSAEFLVHIAAASIAYYCRDV